ncbi:MAG TPA: cell envelope integrity protein CreD [Oligoflexus sp.]|uniref:cell envelope integrity protein CreD n=1 Tax=Oligoflexus sp. TaxID=1971216 RepID=UPI002D230951|nr:cell envelope integrity protein CreD [Oligoflexus sp.]HYX38104.1 cell envelope integrity protein CreD [Oligoflexus sp.]
MISKGLLKVGAVGGLGLILLVALILIGAAVSERSERRAAVLQEMTQTSAGEQVLSGPVLVLPYELHTQATAIDSKGVTSNRPTITRYEKVIMPRVLSINGQMQTEKRYRSLYEALIYATTFHLEGSFEFPDPKDVTVAEGSRIHWLKPYVVVLVKDARGITTIPNLKWNGGNIPVKPGQPSAILTGSNGFHAEVSEQVREGGRFSYEIDFLLRGTHSLSWIPLAEATTVTLSANWPHPSFQGRSLPKSHSITGEGFTAAWESTRYATNIPQVISNQLNEAVTWQTETVGLRLIQPVDIYQQAERSVKYGALFIFLTFAAFLLFEVLKKLPIHPVQYGLVGLALVLFYLLLLGLSEHIDFAWAYGIATLSSVSLLGFYLRHALHSKTLGAGFAASLAGLYGIMYGIILSEDYALLYGSILLFALLAGAMIATRRVNWYALKS